MKYGIKKEPNILPELKAIHDAIIGGTYNETPTCTIQEAHKVITQMPPVHASLPNVVAPAENAKLDGVGASRKGQNVAVNVVAMAIVTQMSIMVNDYCQVLCLA